MTARASLIAVLLAALVGAGCDGGGDGAASGDERAAETAITDEHQALAEAAVLQLTDFPTGWRAEMDEDEEQASDVCANIDLSDLVTTGRAESENFMLGSVTTAWSVVSVYEDGADQAFGQFASDETANCFRDFLQKEDPPGDEEIGEVTVGEISFPKIREMSRAYQIVIPVESEGPSPSFYVDLVFLQNGRSVGLVVFVDALTPFDDDLKVQLSKAVASRME